MSEDNKDDYIKKEENNSELEKQSEVDENNSTKEKIRLLMFKIMKINQVLKIFQLQMKILIKI